MLKYRRRFLLGLALYIPIAFLIWVVPYAGRLNVIMTEPNVWRGNSVYVFLLFVLASIVQFYMGLHFYQSAYKSLKHKSANMDVLVVVSTSAAWLYGVALMIIGYSTED